MFIAHLIERIRSYARYRASVRALSELSDRELADIGVTRGTIIDVSRAAI
jgi:uncharacterized protein YjiS (DUF1127 family)